MSEPVEGFTQGVVDEVLSLDFDHLRPDLWERSRHCLLDWTGVTLAGSQFPSAQIALAVMLTEGGNGRATVLGTDARLGAQGAALVNGVASHVLDFDDSCPWMWSHPSAPIVAATLAYAEQRGASGRQVLEAIIAGIHGQSMIGVATGSSPYDRGIHHTGALGAFGATIAAAHISGLDAEQLARALSLAATQAIALIAMFGTHGKHLNAGKPASIGILSAELAENGFTAPPDAIESRLGWEFTQSTTFDPVRAYEAVKNTNGVEEVVFKYFACCHDTHSAVGALSAIREQRPFDAEDVALVRLGVPRSLLDVCAIADPTTGLEGKFSIQYVVSRALAGESLGAEAFTDAEVNRADLAAIRSRVELVVDREDGPATLPTNVLVQFGDGQQLSDTYDALRPSNRSDLPRERELLSGKFLSLAGVVVGADRAAELLSIIERVEEVGDIAELTRLTTPVEVNA